MNFQKGMNIYGNWIKKYMKRFGMNHFRFDFMKTHDLDVRGSVSWDIPGRLATFSLSPTFVKYADTKYTNIKRTAFHEVLELVLNEIRQLAERDSSKTRVDSVIHEIIRRFENDEFNFKED